MSKESDFNKFLSNIEPSKTTKQYISSIHNTLREYLSNCNEYKDKVDETFLTGSYAKHTCIRPSKNDGKPDVDIAVITNYTTTDDSKEVLDELYDVLQKKYPKIKKQSRSIGIEMEGIEIDVVPMINKEYSDLLQIGNKSDGKWKDTNPKKHLEWCTETNKNNNNRFVPLVKIFKWWRKNNCPDTIKYPKGITLEKIIADNISAESQNYEHMVYSTMKNIKDSFGQYIDLGLKIPVYDPGILTDNLSDGYKFEDYKSFYNKISRHIKILEEKNFSNEAWREILGTEFPKDSSASNYLRSFFDVPHKEKTIWNESVNINELDIQVTCKDRLGNNIKYLPDGNEYLDKNVDIEFKVVGGRVFSDASNIYWQVVNTGEEAKKANCLRGQFELSNIYNYGRRESTAYTGTHWVQAYMIKDNCCIAKSKEILVKVK